MAEESDREWNGAGMLGELLADRLPLGEGVLLNLAANTPYLLLLWAFAAALEELADEP